MTSIIFYLTWQNVDNLTDRFRDTSEADIQNGAVQLACKKKYISFCIRKYTLLTLGNMLRFTSLILARVSCAKL